MSDQDVVRALDAMEQMLLEGRFAADQVASWSARFDAAKASAERGPGWPEISGRCANLRKRLDQAVAEYSRQRDEIGRQLHQVMAGGRALRGYKPS